MMGEQFSNAAQTSLQASIVAGSMGFEADPSLFNTSGPFNVIVSDDVNQEIVRVASVSGSTWTVLARASEPVAGVQTAFPFAAGAVVAQVVTNGGLQALGLGGVVTVTESVDLPGGAPLIVIEGDRNAGSLTITTAGTETADGYVLEWIDTAPTVTSANTVTFTDEDDYPFQDPDDLTSLLPEYTPVSPRNLAWKRVTCARTGDIFWSAR